MEVVDSPTLDNTPSPCDIKKDFKKGLDSKWKLEDNLPKASESELRSLRLAQFNEKIKEFLDKQTSQKHALYKTKRIQNVVTDVNYIAPHIKVGPNVIRPTVVTVGDPFRCADVAKICEKHEEIQWNREYRLFNVTFEGADLSVISHGIGGPGAAICFEELVKLGAKTIIRLGTCGAMQANIKTGDLIVASGACREDGYTDFVAPKGFPAVGDNELTLALYNQAIAMNATAHIGVCNTNGMFYQGSAIPSTLKANADTGALMVEMEVAALFIVGTMRGVRTAAIATADGNVFNKGDYDPHGTIVAEGKKKMLNIGLNVAKMASVEDNEEEVSIFETQSEMKYLDLFKTSSLYDFVQNHSSLSDKQRSTILKLAQKKTFSNF